MKNTLLSILAVSALLMATAVSCGDNGHGNNSDPQAGRDSEINYIKKMTYSSDDESLEEMDIFYGAGWKLNRIVSKSDGQTNYEATYKWHEEGVTVQCTFSEDSYRNGEFTTDSQGRLQKLKVTEDPDFETMWTYTYSDGFLSRYGIDGSEIMDNVEWHNGNMNSMSMKIVFDEYDMEMATINYKYSDSINNYSLDLNAIINGYINPYEMPVPQFPGLSSKNLISSFEVISEDGSKENYYITYELDDKGRVAKLTSINVYEGDPYEYKEVFEFTYYD